LEENHSLIDWLALSFISGVGSRTATALLDKFGSPAACFNASRTALEFAGIKREVIDQLHSFEPRLKAEEQLKRVEELGASVLTLADEGYPNSLRETYDPPLVLYCLGNAAAALSRPTIAIVGSRKCSTYGRNVAEMLARELAARGITIVSGLARGIDSCAHRGALDGRGITVAVTGTGIDEIYPKENKRLAEEIQERGAIVTEFPLGTPPLPQNFPFRNRIISGISLGVMVVEGAERSGSLITARLAYEQGREVFAVPGNITSSKSFGPNYLIKDGAKLVQTWRDVVEELPHEIKSQILTEEKTEVVAEQITMDDVVLTDIERKVFDKINYDEPIHFDRLMTITKCSFGELNAALVNLELLGRIRQLPGNYYARKL